LALDICEISVQLRLRTRGTLGRLLRGPLRGKHRCAMSGSFSSSSRHRTPVGSNLIVVMDHKCDSDGRRDSD
jgi:hypothetical protein